MVHKNHRFWHKSETTSKCGPLIQLDVQILLINLVPSEVLFGETAILLVPAGPFARI